MLNPAQPYLSPETIMRLTVITLALLMYTALAAILICWAKIT
ncbi:hypothetical protein [Undibacterium squillarum]